MYKHVVTNPEILGGKPIIRGTRISVEFILELFASGADHKDILNTYPHLPAEGVEEALRYAAHTLKNDSLLIAEVAN